VALTNEALAILAGARDPSLGSMVVPWPVPGNPAALVPFATFAEWQEAIAGLRLRKAVPQIVVAKFNRAGTLHLLARIDFDLIKAGELAALTSLEFALTDRYGNKVRDKKGKSLFSPASQLYPKHDGLTDDKLPVIQRSGGSVVDILTGKRQPTLAKIRSDLVYGYPFDGFPNGDCLNLFAI
jgi:hypothetical protein